MFKPYERIASAKEALQLCSGNEALYRGIIHQSYYSAFNQMNQEVDNRLFYPVDDQDKFRSVHKAYIDSCIAKKDSLQPNSIEWLKLDKLVTTITRLRGLRRKADYDIEAVVRLAECELSILQSEQIFNILESLE